MLLGFSTTSLAQEKYFKDVPEGHWANEAVYDLVRRGVTSGFPDGTYLGNKKISRYELASFISKLADSFGLEEGKREKLVAELKSEVNLLKYEESREDKVLGSLESRWFLAGRADYRLKMFLTTSLVKLGFDTMDGGFNSAIARSLATKMFEAEGKLNAGAWQWGWTFGPGKVLHVESGTLFPSEHNYVFFRPDPAVSAATASGRFSFAGTYTARSVEASGLIGVHDLTARMAYDFGKVALLFQPRYLFKVDGPRDLLGDIGLIYQPNDFWRTDLLFSVGSKDSGLSGLYGRLSQRLGKVLTLRLDAVGGDYRTANLDKYEFVPLNNFDRYIFDGTIDLGLKIDQPLSRGFNFEAKADYVTDTKFNYGAAYPETYLEWQAGLNYAFAEQVTGRAFYRQYYVPSGLAQFTDPVPTFSDLIGVGLTAGF